MNSQKWHCMALDKKAAFVGFNETPRLIDSTTERHNAIPQQRFCWTFTAKFFWECLLIALSLLLRKRSQICTKLSLALIQKQLFFAELLLWAHWFFPLNENKKNVSGPFFYRFMNSRSTSVSWCPLGSCCVWRWNATSPWITRSKRTYSVALETPWRPLSWSSLSCRIPRSSDWSSLRNPRRTAPAAQRRNTGKSTSRCTFTCTSWYCSLCCRRCLYSSWIWLSCVKCGPWRKASPSTGLCTPYGPIRSATKRRVCCWWFPLRIWSLCCP